MRARLIVSLALSLFALSAHAQLTGGIKINGGQQVTNNPDRRVDLAIYSRGATYMMISNNGNFIGARWENYSIRKPGWRLTDGDGLKSVYVKFKDASGNVSPVVHATIELDRVAPTNPSLIVNAGKEYTNKSDRLVLLELDATDATEMQISNRSDFATSRWFPIQKTVPNWRLTGGDGRKVVYARFRDKIGNESEVVQDEIMLDITPPTNCYIQLNDGERYATSRRVTVRLQAEGATKMRFKGGGGWVPFRETIMMDLEGGNGKKVVYVMFGDEAGNRSRPVADWVMLDAEPPSNGMLVINRGNRYTNSAEVDLEIVADNASHMMVSTRSDFSDATWQRYQKTMHNFPLGYENGEHFVYVKFKDDAGNESERYEDNILLDTQGPTDGKLRIVSDYAVTDSATQITYIRKPDRKVTLEFKADDAEYMMVSNIRTFYGGRWQKFQKEVRNWELSGDQDGDKFVFVKFRDRAGNESEVAATKIRLDNTPPVGPKIRIDENQQFTNHPEGQCIVEVKASAADYMMVSNDPSFEGREWEPYKRGLRWRLDASEDGVKTVYVKFRDLVGNESEVAADSILMDRQPPLNGSVVINKGKSMTNHPDKIVLVQAEAEEALAMQISNSPEFSGARWRGYTNQLQRWQLSGDDGDKTVYVRFRDRAGNISEAASDNITLDRTPPQRGSVVINDGSRLTNDVEHVTLTLESDRPDSMLVSNDFYFHGAQWQPYQHQLEWKLAEGDGLKSVYAKFKDNVGNVSRMAFARIGVDTEAPKEGKMRLNRGATYCTEVEGEVNLEVYAQGVNEMLVSNYANFDGSEWQPYQGYMRWRLDEESDGEKTVYVMFRDAANNQTTPISSSIILDRQAPYDQEVKIDNGAEYTNDVNNYVQLSVFAKEATEMMVSNDRDFRGYIGWQPYAESMDWQLEPGDGYRYVYVRFRDEAGNVSSTSRAVIKVDKQAPIPRGIRFNDGKPVTTNPNVDIHMERVRGADFMMVSNDKEFPGGVWEPFTPVKAWSLPSGEGLRHTYLKFKDKAGNETDTIEIEITVYVPVTNNDEPPSEDGD